MPLIKAGLTSFRLDTSKRSDILFFNAENHRDNHCMVLIFSKLFSEFLWAQSQTVLLSAEACLLFCLRPVGSAQRGNMHRPGAELYHTRHVYSEDTWKTTCFQSAAAQTRPASHEPLFSAILRTSHPDPTTRRGHSDPIGRSRRLTRADLHHIQSIYF